MFPFFFPFDDDLVPNPDPAVIPGLDGVAELAISWLKWGSIITGLGALIIAAIAMGFAFQRGESWKDIGTILKILLGIGIALSSTGIITAIVTASGA
jgi:hypothetical protein